MSIENPAATFELLHHRYRRRVYARCLRMLRDPTEAEDAVQQSFLIVLRLLSERDDLSSRPAWPWLYHIATYVCLHVLRAARRRRARVVTQAEVATAGSVDVHEQVAARELIARVVAPLDTRDHEIIACVAVHGFTQKDTARRLGMSRRAVVKRLHRLRRKRQLKCSCAAS